MSNKIKWGIVGTGWISDQFVADLAHVTNGEGYAVGSRTIESATEFAAKHQISRAYGSYEELAQDPEVDAIYIGTPHPFHKENVLTALRAGKAVLCEKPFTVNSKELEELIGFARERKLFLMEAMWTRFLPPIRQVREWIHAGHIGEVKLVKAEFGFRVDWNPEGRLLNPELGGGALLDAGIYPVSFASMVFGPEPEHVWSTAHIGETGVDETFSILLDYGKGRTAMLNGAVRLGLTNEAYIHGTKGYIHIPSFLNSTSATLVVDGEEAQNFQDDRSSTGYAFEAEEVGRCLNEGLLESSTISLDESLGIMKLMDQIRSQWGLRYPFE
ncbi:MULTISPECIES: Gfo/Idh/MocA family protein [Paenibacillus]|uniref:Gfo/Idh/MocA family oxidoreductase n=1 Tax=Paenibacillus peoriae TaxID=59893 RepID=A0A7H0YB82_9BACL|nr:MULTISPECIES: Gfo/Idh/MocA family oxidoreductase [Paenibacillus]PNQ78773.1 dehydrogenase [Paenibacillus sp. F4]QNR68340.1 Gfo/Idh/MocA family oxidoreductase [Paenibacillus peoriae]